MSWKVEVQTSGDSESWSSNNIRFANEKDAGEYAADLTFRWLAVTRWRVVESSGTARYSFTDGKLDKLDDVDGNGMQVYIIQQCRNINRYVAKESYSSPFTSKPKYVKSYQTPQLAKAASRGYRDPTRVIRVGQITAPGVSYPNIWTNKKTARLV